jgi:hypothetical protein
MAPLSGSLEVMGEGVVELLAHVDDTLSHALNLTLPLRVELRVAEDGIGDASTMDGRVGVHGADDDLKLAVDASLLLRVGSGQRERANALAVETHVLGKGLAERNLVALLDEVADGKGILDCRARGKTLVSHVEEGEELLLLANIGDFGPLLFGRVNTGRVVGAGVEKDDGALGCRLQIGLEAFKVEADGRLVEISVAANLESGITEDGDVVSPCGSGKVDCLGVRVVTGEEGASNTEGASAGDGLRDRNLFSRLSES